jgi:PAS domain S-box-containing protein
MSAQPDNPHGRTTPPLIGIDHALVAAFLENVPDKVYFKDRESRFIAVSKSTAAQHGCAEPSEMIGKTDYDFFHPDRARSFRAAEEKLMTSGVPILNVVEKEEWGDGRITWALTSKVPVRDQGGMIIGMFGLTKDVTKAHETEAALEKARQDLIEASRLAGMAEVATGVLHNVGNVLNSVNVSATVITESVRHLKVESLESICALLRQHRTDLAAFLTADPKGSRVVTFLETLAAAFREERQRLGTELESLVQNVDHIKEVVAMQQSYATMTGARESLDAVELIEDAVRMNDVALARHQVTVVRDFFPVPRIFAERGRFLQIMINLIRNAKCACDESNRTDKLITLRIAPGDTGFVRFEIEDNGIGIRPEHLTRIFAQGFTTRKGGHGLGLHSSALAAKEMKGSLVACSAGPGLGALFTLQLPIAPAPTASIPGQ